MKKTICEFNSIEDRFNFGRYYGLNLADVLDINPSYVCWCVKHCTGVIFRLYDEVIKQIKVAYPSFKMDNLFESQRIFNLSRNSYENNESSEYEEERDYNDFDNVWRDSSTYGRYSGQWAQDVEGYSDDDIDTIFDGDPSAYWNID